MDYSEPNYLAGLAKKVYDPDILSVIRQEYGKNITVFSVGFFAKIKQNWSVEYDSSAGIVYGERSDGETLLLFDASKHGYDSMMGIDDSEDGQYILKTTNLSLNTEVILAFQYTSDEESFLADGHSPYVQDYFVWVAIYLYSEDKLVLFEDFETS